MVNKVRVYGKAQHRTALGIMHAYMVMYPQATLSDIRKAFPDSLNPDSGVKKNFVPANEKGTTANWEGFFRADDEVLTMGDGTKVAVVNLWTKDSFERLIAHAEQYGIEIAKFEAADGVGKKGGFRLEYLNGYVPPVVAPAKQNKKWLIIVVIILLLLLLALFGWWLGRNKPVEPQVVYQTDTVNVTRVDTITVTRVDTITVYRERVEEIEKNFNAAQFAANSAVLNDDAKFALHDLAKVMAKHTDLRLRIVGHTSKEGSDSYNQKLSERRAQAAVDFLVSQGIDAERLEAVGKGSSEPIDPDNLESNRRTEFIVLD